MGARMSSTLGDLADDMRAIAVRAPRELREVVHDGARAGAVLARGFAKKSAGRHGKHYPRAITAQRNGSFAGFGANVYQAEYGPETGRRQGGMSFEEGSKNQPAHEDLKKSADIIGPQFPREVMDRVDRWFW